MSKTKSYVAIRIPGLLLVGILMLPFTLPKIIMSYIDQALNPKPVQTTNPKQYPLFKDFLKDK
jgi:hypothetical protein